MGMTYPFDTPRDFIINGPEEQPPEPTPLQKKNAQRLQGPSALKRKQLRKKRRKK